MLIVLEGPDGSGKSTLAKTIIKELITDSDFNGLNIVYDNIENFIPTKPTSENRISESEMLKKLTTIIKDNKQLFICDRGPISDIIYRVFDKYQSVTTVDKLLLLYKQYNNKVMMIYCRNDVAEQKMLERGDDNPVAIQRHKELTKIYDIFMAMYKMILKYNFQKFNFTKYKESKKVLNNIKSFTYFNYNA